ncbi:hypothetical protein D3C85_1167100 [compost metagenome]
MIIGTEELPFVVHFIRLTFDTPLLQDLIIFRQHVVKEFDDANRIFRAFGNGNTTVVDEGRRVQVLVLNAFVKHDRKRHITLVIYACFCQVVTCIANLPVICEIT